MASSEHDPVPSMSEFGRLAETVTLDTNAGKAILAPWPDNGASGHPTANKRPPAADPPTSSGATSRPADTSGPHRIWIAHPPLQHIVIVGGAAAGLALATKLGDSLGRSAPKSPDHPG